VTGALDLKRKKRAVYPAKGKSAVTGAMDLKRKREPSTQQKGREL